MRPCSLVHRWLRPHWILMWLKGGGSAWGLSFKGMNPFMTLCPHDLPVVQLLCPTLCDPRDCSMLPDFPVLHCLLEFAQIHIHCVGDAIQPSHPLPPPSPLTLNLSQPQGLFQWIYSSHQVAKVFEFKLQYLSSWPNHPAKTPLSNTLTLIRFQHMDTGGTDLVCSSDLGVEERVPRI